MGISKALHLTTGIARVFVKYINPGILNTLDYKINNINDLNYDTDLTPTERVHKALTKFGRMSRNEVVTPPHITTLMVNDLPADIFSRGPVLDIASKQGEFSIALIERFGEHVANKIYSICTSELAYEFTRKVYNLLSIPTGNIYKQIYSKDIHPDRKDIISKLKEMNFAATIGNPPYEKESISTRKPPIYHVFYQVGELISSITTLITPGRFLFKAGQTPKEWMNNILKDTHFKVSHYYPLSKEIFPTIDITGGISIGYKDKEQEYGAILEFTANPILNTILKKIIGNPTYKNNSLKKIISSQGIYRFSDFAMDNFPEIKKIQGRGTSSKITSNIFKSLPTLFKASNENNSSDYIQIIGLENGRVNKWIKSQYLMECEYLDHYNVLIPEANGCKSIGSSEATPIIGQPLICMPRTAHTDTFISIGKFTKNEAYNCLKYIKTKFVRCLLGILKATQHNPKNTWRFVPMQDFTKNSDVNWQMSVDEIDEYLFEKYGLTQPEKDFIKKMIKPMK